MSLGMISQSRQESRDMLGSTTICKAFMICAFFFLLTPSSVLGNDDACIECHAERDMFEDYGPRADSLVVTEATLQESIHAGLECIDCHADLADFTDYPHEETLKPVNCDNCHEDAAEVFATSWHGQEAARRHGDIFAPTCGSCHGAHDILPATDERSMVHPKNLPHTCAGCHTRLAEGAGTEIHLIDAYASYEAGVHADRVNQGILEAASCSDCHGYHDLQKASDPQSRVYKYNIPKTCGGCHVEVYNKYMRGIHGKALAAGVTDSPNCSDCHGEHQIRSQHDPDSPIHGSTLSDYACARCHNDKEMVAKYDLKGGRVSSYQDSYHGMANKRGSTKAASCVSCHETHDILAASNPASSISPGRIVGTCRRCHPTATEEFASSYTHGELLDNGTNIKSIIQFIYISLIIVLIGGMAIHNGIITFHYIRRKRIRESTEPSFDRFSSTMVIQHATLAISFIVLVITGFALRFPDAWWVQTMVWIGLDETTRSVIHRLAAILMIGVSVHHVLFVMFSKRGRIEISHMIPTWTDIRQAIGNMRYHLGLSSEKPDFDRYDYTEKAEYWALAWGTIIMVITGFVLWFPVFYTGFLPGWVIIVSETVHYYEAWLATLAILVWHFYFVMFHPSEYPLSLTWMRGRMSEHELKEKHPAWYRRLVSERAATADEDPIQSKRTTGKTP